MASFRQVWTLANFCLWSNELPVLTRLGPTLATIHCILETILLREHELLISTQVPHYKLIENYLWERRCTLSGARVSCEILVIWETFFLIFQSGV